MNDEAMAATVPQPLARGKFGNCAEELATRRAGCRRELDALARKLPVFCVFVHSHGIPGVRPIDGLPCPNRQLNFGSNPPRTSCSGAQALRNPVKSSFTAGLDHTRTEEDVWQHRSWPDPQCPPVRRARKGPKARFAITSTATVNSATGRRIPNCATACGIYEAFRSELCRWRNRPDCCWSVET